MAHHVRSLAAATALSLSTAAAGAAVPGGWMAGDLIGAEVVDSAGQTVGHLDDLQFDERGRVSEAVIVLGLRQEAAFVLDSGTAVVPWSRIEADPAGGIVQIEAPAARLADVARPLAEGEPSISARGLLGQEVALEAGETTVGDLVIVDGPEDRVTAVIDVDGTRLPVEPDDLAPAAAAERIAAEDPLFGPGRTADPRDPLTAGRATDQPGDLDDGIGGGLVEAEIVD